MLSEITEKIVRNCKRMDSLVKNLLTLADIDNIPKNRMQKSSLSSITDNIRRQLLANHSDANLKITHLSGNLTLRVDPDLLELALFNLIDNAAKYSRKPAQIELSTQSNDGFIEIRVRDRGIGIPESDLPHVFERFYTVSKSHARKLGGAGLGLSIVKNIIEKHDGKIRVESKLGAGTTFTVSLPT